MAIAHAGRGTARVGALVVAVMLAALAVGGVPAHAGTGATTLVSVSRTGGAANNDSAVAAITPNGQFILFNSRASNLVSGDTNGVRDVFVRNLTTGHTWRVSVGPHGRQANRGSNGTAISPDGRFVVFTSDATNLVRRRDTNGVSDVFVRDRATGHTIRVSVGLDGRQYAQQSWGGVITADGNVVAFAHEINGDVRHVYIRNRSAGTTHVVDRHRDAEPDAISDNGQFLAFSVEDDHGVPYDLYLRNRLTGKQVKVPSPDSPVFDVAMTPDGQYLAFSGLDPNGSGQDAFRWQRGDATATTIRDEPADFIAVQGISSDGRYVAVTDGTALAAGDTNGSGDVYRIDMNGGPAVRASVTDGGVELPHGAFGGDINGDGTIVAFTTHNPAVVIDTNHDDDVYVRTGL